MGKKVNFKPKPTKRKAETADEWVTGGATVTKIEPEKQVKVKTTRYTIDIPVELHAQIKIKCFQQNVKMKDEILKLLQKRFGG
jgi:transcriptional regulator